MPAGSEGDETTKTWASGRKLSAAERARKREVDRKTKAESRLKATQFRLELEAKLQDSERRYVAQQSQVSELLQVVEELKKDNERYRHELGSLRNAEGQYREPNNAPLSAGHSPIASGVGMTESPGLPIVSEASSPGHLNAQPPIINDKTLPSFVNSSEDTTIDPTELSILNVGSGSDTVISQRLILSARKVSRIPLSSICLDDAENQDSLIRIALSGNVGKAMECPAWERMIETFEQCIQYCGTVERFVMLRLVHQMILFQIARRSGHGLALPDWYKPRPVQMRVPHEELADYFAWPSFRERLVFSLSAIAKDDFWVAFASNFQFCGPHLNPDNILRLGTDGKYSFMPAFENDMRNLKYWRMRLEFFDKFPQLYDSMVPLEPLPQQMSNKDMVQWTWPAPSIDLDKKIVRRGRVQNEEDKDDFSLALSAAQIS